MRQSDNAYFIADGVLVHESAIIEPGVVILNSKEDPTTSIGANVKIGANATILGGVRLGDNCIVKAGAVVDRDVPPRVIVGGNPAVIVGYAQSASSPLFKDSKHTHSNNTCSDNKANLLLKNGASVIGLSSVTDLRGDLCVGEVARELSFTPARFFFVYNVPTVQLRGEHAHKACHQFLVCVSGSCNIVVDDGSERREVVLSDLSTGVYMPPLTWGIQYKYSSDAILLVLASHAYDPNDYIRDYEQFCQIVLLEGKSRE